MCVGIKSCNTVIIGDCGRYPLYIETIRRCVKYWIRILKLPENRLVKICYNVMKYFDDLGFNNWVTEIKILLQTNGFGYIWESHVAENESTIISEN